ncbi:hypothetical protein [Sphaerisporangium rhizosphaerae]|uniref:XRE family transcriptional regulator n=1 Tax=Sphaerisporangium rhizosphaerae TaxID=2269375 RepID=A0ABW2NWD3_9ACTN
MSAFVLGVLSSILATALTVTAGWVVSPWARQLPITLLSRLTGLGLRRLYLQQRLANLDLPAELVRARWVKVLAGRGNEMTRDGFAAVWQNIGKRLRSVEILLPDPELGPASWLAMREAELLRIDPGFAVGLLGEQIRLNAAYITAATSDRQDVRLRFYDLPNLHRVIVTDRVAYLTIYGPAEHGRNSPCLEARRPGLLYDYALLLFATAWEHSRPASVASTEH